MLRFKLISCVGAFVMLTLGCKGQSYDFSVSDMVIISNGDRDSEKIADYFYHHLRKRTPEHGSLHLNRSDKVEDGFSGNTIYFELVRDLDHDYEIRNDKNRLSIFGKSETTLKWLVYALIDRMAEEHRVIDVSNVPPRYLEFENRVGDIQVLYRDPHLLPNLDPEYSGVLGTHNVDNDWGLWGHNIQMVFPDDIDSTAFALVDGHRTEEQFCFSSPALYEAVVDYVMDQYGAGEDGGKWFMLAPNDNDMVCNCSACKKLGNTPTQATPAVADLLSRVAKRYPKHLFFTIAYRTTDTAPSTAMPDNAGVFISTAELSKAPNLDIGKSDVRVFAEQVEAWREQSKHIYIWDYISNFDDYLTPYPVLLRVQSQLAFFKEQGINGVFQNGSGYDYSPFDDVKAYVLAALLIDASLSVKELVYKYFRRFYPVGSDILTSYYLKLEDASVSRKMYPSMYFPYREAADSYFDPNDFIEFYHVLEKLLPDMHGEEEYKVEALLTALSFTYLQILYHGGRSTEGFLEQVDDTLKIQSRVNELLEQLKKASNYSYMNNYKEDSGQLAVYIAEWEKLFDQKRPICPSWTALQVFSLESGEKFTDGSMLSDHVKGFSSDFNQGWFIRAVDLRVEGTIGCHHAPLSMLRLDFLRNSRHRMQCPDRVEIYVDDVLQGSFRGENMLSENEHLVRLEVPIHAKKGQRLTLKIFKNQNSLIVCDEIQLF